ncbi:MAG: methyl-accepting chemotaxis protein [Pseudomonadota bacterium]
MTRFRLTILAFVNFSTLVAIVVAALLSINEWVLFLALLSLFLTMFTCFWIYRSLQAPLPTILSNNQNQAIQYSSLLGSDHAMDEGLVKQASLQPQSTVNDASKTIQTICIAIADLEQQSKNLRDTSNGLKHSAQKSIDTVRSASREFEALNASVQEMSYIAKTILDISNITQLLAFNASIEAKRAGESGGGFALVANEFKQLTQKINKATERVKEISKVILIATYSSWDEISQAEKSVNEVGKKIYEFADTSEKQSKKVHSLLGQAELAADTLKQVKVSLVSTESVLKTEHRTDASNTNPSDLQG